MPRASSHRTEPLPGIEPLYGLGIRAIEPSRPALAPGLAPRRDPPFPEDDSAKPPSGIESLEGCRRWHPSRGL